MFGCLKYYITFAPALQRVNPLIKVHNILPQVCSHIVCFGYNLYDASVILCNRCNMSSI